MTLPLPFPLDPATPVLIAGPTASGKSALALQIAQEQGGVIVNADALQVFDGWRLLTARPSVDDEALVPHRLYGHVPFDADYSVGHWLRDVAPLIAGPARPIIVGGTGLYFSALTEGLADIPPTPPELRAEADKLPLATLLSGLDDRTRAGMDTQNRARVQRAWEVRRATGRNIADWQAETPAPLLPVSQTAAFVLDVNTAWLNARIERRFDQMLAAGALAEAAAMWPHWNPRHQSAKAIGSAQLISHLNGDLSFGDARASAITISRQYAKRQRTWFRSRMGAWARITNLSTG